MAAVTTDGLPPAMIASLPLSVSPLLLETPSYTFLVEYLSFRHLRLSILSDFGVHFFHLTSKIKLLRRIGYKVVILWEDREKVFNGITIRELISKGDARWKDQVPPATVGIIEKYRIRDRLLRMAEET
jgi:hypothetical protein